MHIHMHSCCSASLVHLQPQGHSQPTWLPGLRLQKHSCELQWYNHNHNQHQTSIATPKQQQPIQPGDGRGRKGDNCCNNCCNTYRGCGRRATPLALVLYRRSSTRLRNQTISTAATAPAQPPHGHASSQCPGAYPLLHPQLCPPAGQRHTAAAAAAAPGSPCVQLCAAPSGHSGSLLPAAAPLPYCCCCCCWRCHHQQYWCHIGCCWLMPQLNSALPPSCAWCGCCRTAWQLHAKGRLPHSPAEARQRHAVAAHHNNISTAGKTTNVVWHTHTAAN